MIAATVAFVAYIVIAGLGPASELAGVVSALVAIAGLGLAVYGTTTAPDRLPEINIPGWPDLHLPGGRFIEADAIAPSPPWTVRGYGVTYKVIEITRATKEWMGDKSKPSITITADVTRTTPSEGSSLQYRFRNEEGGGIDLEKHPFETKEPSDPPLNEGTRVISVLWDVKPPIKTLAITVYDHFWPDGQKLVIRGASIPPLPKR